MKKYILSLSFISLALLIGLTSCEEVDLTFDQSNAFIAFDGESGSVSETDQTISMDIYYASGNTEDITVTVSFDVTNIANPAIEGTDFDLVGSNTVSFDSDFVQTIEIKTYDNEIRDKDKKVIVTLTASDDTPIGLAGGSQASFELTIVDNEHPLAAWIGTYAVAAVSYGSPGAWDEAWTVTTAPVDGDETKLSCTGIAYGDLPVIATVDQENMTITFPAGANTGNGYGYGPTAIWASDYTTYLSEEDVVGTISLDGTIEVDEMGMVLVDYGNYLWDAFNTTWTKTAKKSTKAVSFVDKLNK